MREFRTARHSGQTNRSVLDVAFCDTHTMKAEVTLACELGPTCQGTARGPQQELSGFPQFPRAHAANNNKNALSWRRCLSIKDNSIGCLTQLRQRENLDINYSRLQARRGGLDHGQDRKFPSYLWTATVLHVQLSQLAVSDSQTDFFIMRCEERSIR